MARESSPADGTPTPGRLWAEQLAFGMALFVGILIFMAIFHANVLAAGAAVLGPDDLDAYGWASVAGILLQILVHELGSIVALKWMKLPVRLRYFGFGATAAATLEQAPRRVWIDALAGFAGPLTGTILSVVLALIYDVTQEPFCLGMACVGYFYNLVTLIPILDLEGGWIAPAVAPQWWLIGLAASVLELTSAFNLVLLGVVCFALPRFVLILRARAPRTDIACSGRQRLIVGISYFVLVVGLAWFSSTTFADLPSLVRGVNGKAD
jgi:hypothetical protein